ncbi:MAG: hypothetical protein Q9221_007185 [Calogaya cf. arnoldii]
MWLINVHTLKLEEVWGETVKKYAILSHRKGFSKITKSCKHARDQGYDYVWVDTCCINKESSAELSEAINSMFRWYKASGVCYAYLSDVDRSETHTILIDDQVKQSQWFTRGWTLQELLAPNSVILFDRKWACLGTKQTLSKIIEKRTGIEELALHGKPLADYSIAQRMSWASRRKTTRVEDIAYCLLGIFDVNMPMLYGEGEKAFMRLQEEIIKQSDDHTIFAWPIDDREQAGLLADSPSAFANCRNVRVVPSRKDHSSYALTNRGLSCKFIATMFAVDTYLVRLDCTDSALRVDDGPYMGMFLRRLLDDDQYARVRYQNQTFMRFRFKFILPFENPLDETLLEAFRCDWDQERGIMLFKPGEQHQMGIFDLRSLNGRIAYLKLGFDFACNPVCFLLAEESVASHKLHLDQRTRSYQHNQFRKPRTIWNRTPFDDDGWGQVDHDGCAYDLNR